MAETKKKKKTPKKIEPIMLDDFLVFAADLSMRRPGFALIRYNHGELTLENVHSVDNKNIHINKGMALDRIDDDLKVTQQFISLHRHYFVEHELPIYIVREAAINSRAAQAEIGMFEACGITTLWGWRNYHSLWNEIYPITVKRLVAGTIKASKDEIADGVKVFFPNATFANDDESDACAVGLAFLMQGGLIKPHEPVHKEEKEKERGTKK